MLGKQGDPVEAGDITLHDRAAWSPDGRSVTLRDIAMNSLHTEHHHQIMAVGSYVSPESPPPFAAQFATVTVDAETGQVTVDELVMAVDSGVIINPTTASGQIEGGMVQAAGYGLCEELAYDDAGRVLNPRFGAYWVYRSDDVPALTAIFVETYEESGPFGAKAVAEIPMDGAGPAIANAVYDAVGVRIKDAPLYPEKVWRAMKESIR
jgi:putative selenate reductase molybdopterin-binding subunit